MAIQSKFVTIAVACVACIAGLATALILRDPGPPAVRLTSGTYLAPSRTLPDFSLIDHHGKTFTPASLRGHWSLMFFGYTNCPDFCPTTLTLLAAMEKSMKAREETLRPQVIFVSVDAQRDTPAQLARYVPYFDPDFLGVTAPDQSAIEALARKMGVAVNIQAPVDGVYTVDHSAEIFVLNPAGRLTAILTGPYTVDALRSDFRRIVGAQA